MSRTSRIGGRSFRSVAGVIAAVAVLAALLPLLAAAEPVDRPPVLLSSSAEPLPPSLRRTVPESLDDLRAIETRVTALIDELREVTVGLQRGPAQGTGVIVSREGHILTAAHVSGPPGRRVTVMLNSGRHVRGVSMGCHTALDAGLVKITDAGNWPVARVGDMEDVERGDWVIGTGHPGGFDDERLPVIRLGRVIAKMKWVLHTDVTLVGGDSGGPLFDLTGRVVGIHSRIGPGAELNFHVPVSAYQDNWYWMLASEQRPIEPSPGGAMLGVDGEDVQNGCRVTRITAGSPAEKAGLRPDDVIRRIDARFVRGLDDLVSSVNHYLPGESISIAFERGGERRNATVILAERPSRGSSGRR